MSYPNSFKGMNPQAMAYLRDMEQLAHQRSQCSMGFVPHQMPESMLNIATQNMTYPHEGHTHDLQYPSTFTAQSRFVSPSVQPPGYPPYPQEYFTAREYTSALRHPPGFEPLLPPACLTSSLRTGPALPSILTPEIYQASLQGQSIRCPPGFLNYYQCQPTQEVSQPKPAHFQGSLHTGALPLPTGNLLNPRSMNIRGFHRKKRPHPVLTPSLCQLDQTIVQMRNGIHAGHEDRNFGVDPQARLQGQAMGYPPGFSNYLQGQPTQEIFQPKPAHFKGSVHTGALPVPTVNHLYPHSMDLHASYHQERPNPVLSLTSKWDQRYSQINDSIRAGHGETNLSVDPQTRLHEQSIRGPPGFLNSHQSQPTREISQPQPTHFQGSLDTGALPLPAGNLLNPRSMNVQGFHSKERPSPVPSPLTPALDHSNSQNNDSIGVGHEEINIDVEMETVSEEPQTPQSHKLKTCHGGDNIKTDQENVQRLSGFQNEEKKSKVLSLQDLLGRDVALHDPFGEVLSQDQAVNEILNQDEKVNNKFDGGLTNIKAPASKGQDNVAQNPQNSDNESKASESAEHFDSDEEVERRLSCREDTDRKHLCLQEVLRYKQYGIYPPGKDKANFRKQTRKYVFENNSLMYITKTNGVELKLIAVVERKKRLRLIRKAHDGSSTSLEAAAMSSHNGRDGVTSELCLKYHWPGITRDIRTYLLTCETCQRVEDVKFKVVPELRPVGVPSEVMKQVGVDLMDLGMSDGKRYVVVLIDYFSKWTEAEALADKQAEEVAAFLHKVMCRHGCFSIQINDQGREFVNKVSEELHRLSGTKQRITSAYHPQANGLVERQNKTLKNSLKKTLLEKKEKWPYCLQSVVFAHRTMVHKSTKYSPFFMVYGRHPKTPWDVEMEADVDEVEGEEDDPPVGSNDLSQLHDEPEFDESLFKERVEKMLQLRDVIKETASKNIKNAQKRQKDYYDQRHMTPNCWKIGDTVMIVNKRNEGRKGGKLDINRSTGYEIVEIDGNYRCLLRNIKTGVHLKTKYPSVQLVPLSAFTDKDETRGNACSGEKKRKKEKDSSEPDQENVAPPARKSEEPAKKPTDLNPLVESTYNETVQVLATDAHEVACRNDGVLFNRVGENWQRNVVNNTTLRDFRIKILPLQPAEKPCPLTYPCSVIKIVDDGNCWFRAMSFFVFGTQEHYHVIRRALTTFMLQDDTAAKIRESNGPDFFKKWTMTEDRVWATDAEIMATAVFFETDIYVFSRVESTRAMRSKRRPLWGWLRFPATAFKKGSPLTDITRASVQSLFVYHQNMNHYLPVLDVHKL